MTGYKTGEVEELLDAFTAAAELWRRELAVRQAMTAHESDHYSVADDLASCHNQIGGALERADNHKGALVEFEAYLTLSTQVLQADQEGSSAQRSVAVG